MGFFYLCDVCDNQNSSHSMSAREQLHGVLATVQALSDIVLFSARFNFRIESLVNVVIRCYFFSCGLFSHLFASSAKSWHFLWHCFLSAFQHCAHFFSPCELKRPSSVEQFNSDERK